MNCLIIYAMAFVVLSHQGTSCIYSQKTVFQNPDSSIVSPSATYENALTWTSAQSSIISYAYTFIGLNIQSFAGGAKFDAVLQNMTSTGGIFKFTPLAGTQIIKIVFSVILLKTCNGSIELRYFTFIPTIFNQANRTTHQQSAIVSLGTTITGSTANYLIYGRIASFYLESMGVQMTLSVNSVTFTLDSNIITVLFYSKYQSKNVFTKIGFTVILVQITSFNYQLVYYQSSFQTFSSFTYNFGIPSHFNPFLSQKCIFGIRYIDSLAFSTTAFVLEPIFQQTSNITSITSITSFHFSHYNYDAFCLQNCSVNSYLDYSLSNSTCIPCQNRSQFCQQCTPPSFACTKCQPNFFLFSSKSVCYSSCPAGYYGDSAVGICVICSSECITCENGHSCKTCLYGSPISGVCIDVEGCISATKDRATNTAICLACRTELNFEPQGNACVCKSGFRLVSEMCINITGCMAATALNICASCNSMQRFRLWEGTCICMDGFQLKNGTCTEVCGDGKLFTLPCDDGNNINGDGCSSACKVEKDYACSGGSPLAPSVCQYTGKYITLALSTITNSDVANQAVFTFTITPPLFNLRSDITESISLKSSTSLSIDSAEYSAGQLLVYVGYNQNIEGLPASFTLSLSGAFLASSYTIDFTIKSNGMQFNYIANPQGLKTMQSVFLAYSIIVAAVFLVSLYAHKMIGVELIVSFQVITLMHSTTPNYTAPYSLFHVFSVLNANPLYIHGFGNNIDSVQKNIAFNSKNRQFSFEVIAGTCLLLLGIFALLNIISPIINLQKKCENKLSNFINALYNKGLFPLAMGFYIPFFSMLFTHKTQNQTSSIISYFIPFQALLTFAIFFYQWKVLALKQPKIQGFEGTVRCKQNYIAYNLTLMLLSVLLLSLSFHFSFIPTFTGALGLYGLYFIWLIAYRPYQSRWHNLGLFANCFMVLSFLTWTFLRERYSSLMTQENQNMAIYVFLGLASLAILATIVRAIFELRSTNGVPKGLESIRSSQMKAFEQQKPSNQLKAYVSKMNQLFNAHNMHGLSQPFQETKNQKKNQRQQDLRKEFRMKKIGAHKKNINDLLL